MRDVITDKEKSIIIQALRIAYQKTIDLVESTPSLKRNKRNSFGYIRNWMIEAELANSFSNKKSPNSVDNCEYTVYYLESGYMFTVEHISAIGDGPRKAIYKDSLLKSLTRSLFSEEELNSLGGVVTSTYTQLMHSGTATLESALIRSSNGSFEPINLYIGDVNDSEKRIILEDSDQFSTIDNAEVRAL